MAPTDSVELHRRGLRCDFVAVHVGNYLRPMPNKPSPATDHPEFAAAEAGVKERFDRYLTTGGTKSPDDFYRGRHDHLGLLRHGANGSGLEKVLSETPLYEEFTKDLRVTGLGTQVNQTLRKAGRFDDFFELGTLDVPRTWSACWESRGGTSSQFQTDEGRGAPRRRQLRPRRAWEFTGDPMRSKRDQEDCRRDRSTSRPAVQVRTTCTRSRT